MTATSPDAITEKLRALSHALPLKKVHFAWYAHYRVTAPALIQNERNDTLYLHCDRHHYDFTSKGRYLYYTGEAQKSLFCLECHYEADNDGHTHKKLMKLRDIQTLFDADPLLGWFVGEKNEEALARFVKNTDRNFITCRACLATCEHNISNIKTHIQNGQHLFCQHCDKKRKGKSKRISFEQAQESVKHYDIDKSSFTMVSKPCLHTCKTCDQRHWLAPQNAKRAVCARCGENGGMPIHVMPTLCDLNDLIQAVSTWQLSSMKADHEHNQHLFARREDLSSSDSLIVACQHHPSYTKKVALKAMKSKLMRNPCRLCAADQKSIYTADFFESEFQKHGIRLRVCLESSNLKTGDQRILEGTPLTLVCAHHGRINKTFTSYSLIRYIREHKVNTPCPECVSDSGNTLNGPRIREFVGSLKRMQTHSALYQLVDSNEEIEANIAKLKQRGKVPYYNLEITLMILSTLESLTLTPAQSTITLRYVDFKKGKRGFLSPNAHVSWLVKFILFFNWQWQLHLQTEKTFKKLKSTKGNLLRLDFYQATLQRVYEIDGSQHVAEHEQIKSTTKRAARFAAQQQRDARVDAFFAAHDTLSLTRIPTYKITPNNKIKALKIHEQFDVALTICQELFRTLHHSEPPKMDRDTFLTNVFENTPHYESKRQSMTMGYHGEFTVERLSADNKVTIRCLHGHYMTLSVAKYYLDKNLADTSAQALCWGCIRCHDLDIASHNLAQLDLTIANRAALKAQFCGTLEAPLLTRGARKKIVLDIAPKDKHKSSPYHPISLEKAMILKERSQLKCRNK
ncbi:hypothetical protein HC723_08770 [Vibrio sp. S11_S32]|uniref:hypothetical protein n=1 Tax=Vibrio sp. S11_S32 TaxID=2720225 RepID=UPI001680C068|nr:hypothetical protein [Vibrio sp. S11_S32]MBD1576527.1 hypothetical protein [Vibrio sp. S11_S32]